MKVTILDGGMGRQLLAMGAPFRQPEWSALALWEDPGAVVRAHQSFIEAGAEVITTNSYAVVPFHIGDERFVAEGERLAARSGELARQAADDASHRVLVAGSLPPLFGSYRPDLFDAEGAPAIVDPLVRGLAPYVDLWLGETLGSIAEAVAVAEALARYGALQPLWLSFTLDDDHPGTLRSGDTVTAAVSEARRLGAHAVLFNCCAPETITAALQAAAPAAAGTLALGGYANRFVVHHDDGHGANEGLSALRDDVEPEAYAEHVQHWIELGATVVGGCCGIGPEHLAEVVRRRRDAQ